MRAHKCVMSSPESCCYCRAELQRLFNFCMQGDCNCNLRALDFLLQRSVQLRFAGNWQQLNYRCNWKQIIMLIRDDARLSEVQLKLLQRVQFLSSPMTLWKLCILAATRNVLQPSSGTPWQCFTPRRQLNKVRLLNAGASAENANKKLTSISYSFMTHLS